MMIIIGHPDVPFDPFYYVEEIDDIPRTPPNCTLWLGPFKETKTLAKHCDENRLPYAVMVANIKEALLANALHAHYLLSDPKLAETLQKIADTYLFDAKILVPVNDENEMEQAAKLGIDGAIFQNAITLPE